MMILLARSVMLLVSFFLMTNHVEDECKIIKVILDCRKWLPNHEQVIFNFWFVKSKS